MWPFIRAFEVWAVARLLSSPTFHRGVGKVVKTVHRIQHGTPMEELGGTKLERKGHSLFQHFKDEIKQQLKIRDHNKRA
ncbi:putative WD repeat-containing protein [Venturia nashicola]|uniref:Putative WD repeat-containing protein n=1 Tax=Venturia nashicola TaxID=86259 RepID=A0A4Z1NU81_9PEZI|nr:putative WD repeat-containing protein [Venturia nashicola]